MKTLILVVSLFGMLLATAQPVAAAPTPEPTLYVVKRGDTLWDLSERFFSDPFYWPNLWSKNPFLGNPHLIYPGQKLRIYPDRVEIIPPVAPAAPADTKEVHPGEMKPLKEKVFSVIGSEGFISEEELAGVGRIVATNHGRVIVGTGESVYTDLGSRSGARIGDRLSIYARREVINHPSRHVEVGYKIIPLGTLELTELTPTGSRATITSSWREIGSGALLLPWQDERREISLKAASRRLTGIMLDSLTGSRTVGPGDVIYIDLGSRQGLAVGNMLHAVRQPIPDRGVTGTIALPPQLLGALVVIRVGRDAATALVVKNAEPMYLGDTVVTVLPE